MRQYVVMNYSPAKANEFPSGLGYLSFYRTIPALMFLKTSKRKVGES